MSDQDDSLNAEFRALGQEYGITDQKPRRDNIVKAPKEDFNDVKPNANVSSPQISKSTKVKVVKPKLEGKISKFLKSKFVNKEIVKDGAIKVDLKKVIGRPYESQDKARYYRTNFEVERRQLFFGN